MKDKLSINIIIDNRGYPLVVDRNDEEKYRQASKLLNEMVYHYRGQYADKDSQDILAMAAFQFVLKYLDEKKDATNELLIDEIKNLNDDVSDFLKQRAETES
ncbi:MAG: cell division protein ZapA [Mariniphaga sp.]|nr:cell division protein ZapA [Mariniphaga sp.]